MPVLVVPPSDQWPHQFTTVAADLAAALAQVPVLSIEHVGSTSVPGLAAKPIIDIAIVVDRCDVEAAIAALERAGYRHRGDLGVTGRQAFDAPDDEPRRHVYVCEQGTVHLRNHLAVREVLWARPDLRERYAEVKLALAADSGMDIERYLAGKSAVLQDVLRAADLTADERARIHRLNDPSA